MGRVDIKAWSEKRSVFDARGLHQMIQGDGASFCLRVTHADCFSLDAHARVAGSWWVWSNFLHDV